MQVMMKCGCSTTATQNGKPVCIPCFGLKPGFDEIDTNPPLVEPGRKAKCWDCGSVCRFVSDASVLPSWWRNGFVLQWLPWLGLDALNADFVSIWLQVR